MFIKCQYYLCCDDFYHVSLVYCFSKLNSVSINYATMRFDVTPLFVYLSQDKCQMLRKHSDFVSISSSVYSVAHLFKT
jgi:hypothetical protein